MQDRSKHIQPMGTSTWFRFMLVLLLTSLLTFPATSTPESRKKKGTVQPEPKAVLAGGQLSTSQRCLHGGVEIGASGVKAVAIRVITVDEGYEADEIYSPKVANTYVMQGVEKTNRLSPEPIKDTALAVDSFCRQMIEKGVPSDQIYVVGSSGLRANNLADLAHEVKEIAGREMTFLNVNDEVAFTISGAVPKYTRDYSGKGKYRKVRRRDNRGRSILLDIGSGNTKGGYQERSSPTGAVDYRIITFGIPFGTKTLADKVSGALATGVTDFVFAAKAQEVGQEVISQPLAIELERKPALVNRPRVYLTGGIVWALATLMHPQNRSPYVTLTATDIDRFYNEALRDPQKLLNPDLSRLDAETREKADSDINAIRSTFSTRQLLAGAEILKTLSSNFRFADPQKALRFVRKGYIAWILRYVNLKSRATEEVCP